MKNILVISLLFFAFFTIQAQTDSIYRERFVKKVNAYRINKGKVKKTLRLDYNLNLAADSILRRGNSLKDSNGNFIKDSVRRILRANDISDYEFEIIETGKNNNVNKRLKKDINLNPKMKSIITDASYNTIGLTTVAGSELTIFTKHYIDFNEFITNEISNVEYSSIPIIFKQTAIIKGSTKLKNITYYTYEYSPDYAITTPLYKEKLQKNKKGVFEVRLDFSESNSKIPYQVVFVDESGRIISHFVITK